MAAEPDQIRVNLNDAFTLKDEDLATWDALVEGGRILYRDAAVKSIDDAFDFVIAANDEEVAGVFLRPKNPLVIRPKDNDSSEFLSQKQRNWDVYSNNEDYGTANFELATYKDARESLEAAFESLEGVLRDFEKWINNIPDSVKNESKEDREWKLQKEYGNANAQFDDVQKSVKSGDTLLLPIKNKLKELRFRAEVGLGLQRPDSQQQGASVRQMTETLKQNETQIDELKRAINERQQTTQPGSDESNVRNQAIAALLSKVERLETLNKAAAANENKFLEKMKELDQSLVSAQERTAAAQKEAAALRLQIRELQDAQNAERLALGQLSTATDEEQRLRLELADAQAKESATAEALARAEERERELRATAARAQQAEQTAREAATLRRQIEEAQAKEAAAASELARAQAELKQCKESGGKVTGTLTEANQYVSDAIARAAAAATGDGAPRVFGDRRVTQNQRRLINADVHYAADRIQQEVMWLGKDLKSETDPVAFFWHYVERVETRLTEALRTIAGGFVGDKTVADTLKAARRWFEREMQKDLWY